MSSARPAAADGGRGAQAASPPRAGRAQVDLERVKPYADHLDDGLIQLSFTLPVPYGLAARRAAQELAAAQIEREGAAEALAAAESALEAARDRADQAAAAHRTALEELQSRR